MKINDPIIKQTMNNRLRRVEGQLRGIQTMVNDERDCSEILQQLSAARSALHGATMDFLHQYAACVATLEEKDPGERQALLDDFIAVLDRATHT
ncbi:MAG: metal-sensitive transcriptional regulator [Anaerolineae bacterium]|nr:metal-sensitive transcriptional regulator [Anaerolineae bacterium]